MVTIRPATHADARAILEIYAAFIPASAISFEWDVPSLDDMRSRIEKCLLRYPWMVCMVNDQLAGYAYASLHRERTAYQWTCECSVYIHDNFRGKGIGRQLYSVLFEILRMQGIRNVYAGITLPNPASISLHESCGFEHFATYDHIGYKLGKWQKVGWWRLLINELDLEPAPPLKFSELDQRLYETVCNAAAQRIQS